VTAARRRGGKSSGANVAGQAVGFVARLAFSADLERLKTAPKLLDHLAERVAAVDGSRAWAELPRADQERARKRARACVEGLVELLSG